MKNRTFTNMEWENMSDLFFFLVIVVPAIRIGPRGY